MIEKPVLRCAAPGILIAALCLLPFLQKAFTIDDPFYLTQAHQAVRTPLTPAATEMFWDNIGFARPIRGIGPPGLAMSYVLIPVALLNDREWVGHLIQLLLLSVAVIATVALAFRCGAGKQEATLAGMFFASFPAVLMMAGTVMPDVLAGTLGVIGLERLLAWKADGKIRQAVAAGIALGLAPLARSHTLLLVPVGLIMLVDECEPLSLRALRTTSPLRWLPIAIALTCFVGVNWLTSDPQMSSALFPAGPNKELIQWRFVMPNLLGYGLNWMALTPFALVWLLLEGATGVALAGVAVVAGGLLQYPLRSSPLALNVVGVMGLLAVGSAIVWSWRTRRLPLIGLAACLLIALPMVAYFHLPSKYLVPCAPAASILLALRISPSTFTPRILSAAMVCLGMALGVTLLRADAEFAGMARRAVAEGLAPQIKAGHRAWYSGQWALTWYAEQAGATSLSIYPPYPEAGDVVLAGEQEGGVELTSRLRRSLKLIQTIQVTEPGIRIMNPVSHAGFYSNAAGYLPASWSAEPVNTYYVWLVE